MFRFSLDDPRAFFPHDITFLLRCGGQHLDQRKGAQRELHGWRSVRILGIQRNALPVFFRAGGGQCLLEALQC